MPNEIDQRASGAVAANEPGALHDELLKTIVLMRHAEKPDDASNPDLSPAGFARAKELADYIPAHYGRKPDILIAAADSKHSSRPSETLQPLSEKTGVAIEASIKDKDFQDLADELKDPQFDGKFIVISWHHGEIPDLARALGAPEGTFPQKWKSSVFDEFLQFDYPATGDTVPAVKEIKEDFKHPTK